MYWAPVESQCGCLRAGASRRQSPVGASASQTLLARILAAPLRFFVSLWRSSGPTFSVSTSRFLELSVPESRCSTGLVGVSPVPGEHGICPVAPCGACEQEGGGPRNWSPPKMLVGVPSQGVLLGFWISL